MKFLRQDEVNEIRRLYRELKYTQLRLSKKFNMSQSQISRIVSSKQWKSSSS